MSNLRHPSVVVPFELVKLLFEGSGVGNCVIVDSHYRGWGVTGFKEAQSLVGSDGACGS